MTTRMALKANFFNAQEFLLVEHASLQASGCRFPSGVEALRLRSDQGELVLLPFQGQQIWSAAFLGRELTMRSMFSQPYPTRNFLETFGGFMQHCGATAMGSPGPTDTHPLHGELPNAPYQKAWVVAGEDQGGAYLSLGGEYEYAMAFGEHYLAQPLVKLYAGASMAQVSMTIHNLSGRPMPLMYLFHINYRPVDGARLVYSAPTDAAHMRVRTDLPGHVRLRPGYAEFIEVLSKQPEKHLLLSPELMFDPEVVFFIDYACDSKGWAYAMQLHPDGSADLVRHQPAQLSHGVRWICRTADQDALGFEAGTAGVAGRTAEQARGNLRWLPPGESFSCNFEFGVCTPQQAGEVQRQIASILNHPGG